MSILGIAAPLCGRCMTPLQLHMAPTHPRFPARACVSTAAHVCVMSPLRTDRTITAARGVGRRRWLTRSVRLWEGHAVRSRIAWEVESRLRKHAPRLQRSRVEAKLRRGFDGLFLRRRSCMLERKLESRAWQMWRSVEVARAQRRKLRAFDVWGSLARSLLEQAVMCQLALGLYSEQLGRRVVGLLGRWRSVMQYRLRLLLKRSIATQKWIQHLRNLQAAVLSEWVSRTHYFLQFAAKCDAAARMGSHRMGSTLLDVRRAGFEPTHLYPHRVPTQGMRPAKAPYGCSG